MPRKRHGFAAGGLVAALAAGLAVVVPALTTDNAAHADSNAVVITELMASNTSTITDAGGGHPDWIELHNTSGSTVSLDGMHLTDDPANLIEWPFPSGVTIAPFGYLVVYAQSTNPGSVPNATFGLSKDGEFLALTSSTGAIVGPSFTFGAQYDDVSFGTGSNEVTGYMVAPTPGPDAQHVSRGFANSTAVASLPRLPKPVLSTRGGYVTGDVTVTAAPTPAGSTVRVTTDGKAPKATSPEVGAGVTAHPGSIVRAATFPDAPGAVASTEASATYLSTAGVLAQPTTPPSGWPASGSAAANGQAFVYGFDQAQVAANGPAISNALTAIPTLSIVTDQKNLTDATTGIYVNAMQSGSSWERGSSVELIDPANPGADFQINAGLRIKGGYGRSPQFARHGFSLRFTDSYDGALTTPAPLFADGISSFASLDLKPENNGSWPWGSAKSTQLREIWTRDAQQAAGDADLQSRRVQLFLNGRYWGMYSIMERMSQPQAAAMYGGDPASYNVLKQSDTAGYEAEAGSDADWRHLWDLTSDQVVTDAEYAEINRLIDVTSLARFIAVNAYTANVDGAVSLSLSSALGTNWTAVGGPGHRYTFLATDAELSLGLDQFDRHNATNDVFGPFPVLAANGSYAVQNFNPGWLHSALLSNPQYRAVFQAVASSLLAPGGLFDDGPSLARWNARKAEVAPLIPAEAARWGHDVPGGPYSLATWQAETNWVETQFFPGRAALVRSQLRSFLLTFHPGNADNNGYGSSRRLGDAHPVP